MGQRTGTQTDRQTGMMQAWNMQKRLDKHAGRPDRQGGQKANWLIGKQADRQTDRQSGGQMDRKAKRQAD